MHWFGRHNRFLSSCWRQLTTSMSSLPIRLRSVPRFVKAGTTGLVIFALGWGQTVPAQDVATPGYVSLDQFSGSMALSNDGGSYLLFDKMIGDGPGVDDGYSRIGLRANLYDTPNGHIFGEAHGLITDGSRLGLNVGGGYRWFAGDAVWGVNSWYDDYETRTGNRYQQIGFGAELLSPGFDARINGYAPIGNRDNYIGLVTPGTQLTYFGNSLGTVGTGAFEASSAGFDLEGGVPVPFSDWARTYAGLYYLSGNAIDTTGVRARVEARFTEGVLLNFIAQNDNTYGTNLNMNVTVQFSGEMPTRFGSPYSALTRRYDQVRRTWAVQTTNYTDSVNVPLVNPDTNKNYNLYWVDNRNAGGGTGTFENPNDQLPDFARNADLILVRRGTGNTVGNLTMLPGQELLGEGKAHFVNTDRLGVIQLPTTNFADTGAFPTLTAFDAARPIITLADNSRVVGFNFAGGTAIAGLDVDNFHLECLTGNVQNGINIHGASGAGVVRDVNFNLAAGGTGVSIGNDTRGPLTLDIDRLTTTSGSIGLEIQALRSPVSMTVNNFTATGTTQAGLKMYGDRTQLNAQFQTVNLSNGTGDGANISLRGGTGTTTFTDLRANDNDRDGLHAVADNTSNYNLNIVDSFLRRNGDDNIDVDAINTSRLNVFVDPTLADLAGDNNLEFLGDNGSTLNYTFLDTNLTQAGTDGINGTVRGGSTVTLNLQRSLASGAGQDGYDVTVINGSSLFTNVANGSFSDAGQHGFSQSVVNGSTATVTLNNTLAENAGDTGFRFNVNGGVSGPSTFNANVSNGSFNNSGVNNVRGTVTQRSQANLNFNNVTASGGASAGGVDLSMLTAGKLTSTWTGGNISNTGSDGVDVLVNGSGSRANLTFSNLSINNNNGDGVNAVLTNAANGSDLSLTFNNASILGNATHGVDYQSSGLNATGTVAFNTTSVRGNRDGLQFDVTNGADLTVNSLTAGNNFSGNLDNAIQGTVTGNSSTANVNLLSINGSGSGNSGLVFDVSNTGVLGVNLTNSNISGSGRSGLVADVTTGGVFNFMDTGSLFSNSGSQGPHSGVDISVDGAGSRSVAMFLGSTSNGNSQDGFTFGVTNGGSLTAQLDGSTNPVSASNNARNGVRFVGIDANQANLVMSGDNLFNSNGAASVLYGVNGANQAVAAISGSFNDGAGDGVNIRMEDVVNGAINLTTTTGTIQNNAGDGIEIDLINTNLTSATVKGVTYTGLNISGYNIADNGGDAINIFSDNSDIAQANITNNFIIRNQNGIIVDLTNGSDWGLNITDNEVLASQQFGIHVTSDSNDTQSTITIDGNTVASSINTNIAVDLSGSAVTELHIDNNLVDGDGLPGDPVFNTGLNFRASTFNIFGSGEPPDTMGAVGPNHLVELLNDGFRVYDKTTGTLIRSSSDEAFWTAAGANLGISDVFDHRIIFDAVSQRWFATTITRGTGNQILVAVSNSADPTAGWQAVQFVGDIDNVLFNDFDTLAVDGDAIVIGTNNFDLNDNFQNVSLFSIPKADLLLAAPSIANLTRFENLDSANVGFTPQPVVSDDVDNRAYVLSADYFNSFNGEILLSQLNNVNAAGATFGGTTQITGAPAFTIAPLGIQPGGTTIDTGGDRIVSNVVEQNGRIWAAQAVDVNGRSGILWYEIDPTTNSVVQSGTIADANLDFFFPSIALNATGEVVIGYSGSGLNQSISSMASFGTTTGGVTAFQAPVTLANGFGTYLGNQVFGGNNRWGDYSATVIDPTNPDTFWTFQEIAQGAFSYSTQITQINITRPNTTTDLTLHEGIRVNASGNAHLLDTTITGNTVVGNGGQGIQTVFSDNVIIDSLNINGNTVDASGGVGVLAAFTDNASVGALDIDNNTVSNSGNHGLSARFSEMTSVTTMSMDDNNSTNNGGDGVRARFTGTSSVGALTVDRNNVVGNGGDGIHVETGSPVTVGGLSVSNNVNVENNGGDGIDILLANILGTPDVNVNANVVQNNAGRGIAFVSTESDFGDISISNNTIDNNTGGNGITVDITSGGSQLAVNSIVLTQNFVTDSSGTGVAVNLENVDLTTFSMANNSIRDNGGFGLDFVATNSPIENVTLINNTIDNSTGGDGMRFLLTDSPVTNFSINGGSSSSNAGDGIDLDLTRSAITNLSVVDFADGGTGGGALGVRFFLDGFTFGAGYELENQSSSGFDITRFTLDISPANAIWDTVEPGASLPFQPLVLTGQTQQSDVITGLLTVNGTTITQGTSPLQDGGGTVLLDGGVPDDQSLMDLTFNDFNPTETFNWEMDVDFVGQPGSGVLGSDLIGSLIRVDFTGGLFLDGLLAAVAGNPQASTFVATGGSLPTAPGGSSNTGNGLRISQNDGSDITNLVIDNSTFQNNGQNGIEFLVSNSTLPATNGTISNNTVSGHANGDGIRLINPDTNGTPFTLNFNGNTVSNNAGGAGINVAINDNAAGMTSDFTGNTITGNGNGGIVLTGTENATLTTTFNGNNLDQNTEVGIGFDLSNNATAAIDIQNTTVTGTVNGPAGTAFNGDGISLQARDDVYVSQFNVQGSTASDNDGHGISVNPFVNTQVDDITIQNSTIDLNGLNGINIVRRDNVNLNSGVRGSILIGGAGNGNSLTNNIGDAIHVDLAGTNATQQINIDANTIDGGANGVQLIGRNSVVIVGSINDNTISNATADGVLANLSNTAALGDPATPLVPFEILGNQFAGNNGDAVEIRTNDNSFANVNIGASAAQRMTVNGGGTGLRITDNSGSPIPSNYVLDGADIANTESLGVVANFAGGGRTLNVNDVNINNAGGAGVNITNASNGGTSNFNLTNLSIDTTGQQGIDLTDSSIGTSNVTLDTVAVTGAGADGIRIQKSAGGVMNADLLAINSQFNAGAGLLIEATNDNGGRSVFNAGEIGGVQNLFTNNGTQGVLFRTRATNISQLQNAGNPDVQVTTGLTNPPVGQYVDPTSTDRVVATMNLFNAQIVGNGADGVLLEVGSNTLMNSQLAGLMLGGNGATDITIRPIVSANPPSSIDDPNPNLDVLVFDPVAHLDLILGSADTNGDGLAENNASTHNSGTQIGVAFAGANFTNADPFKNNRAVQLAGHVQIDTLLNTPSNNFVNIVQQDIQALFSGQPFFNIVPQTLFPDNNP